MRSLRFWSRARLGLITLFGISAAASSRAAAAADAQPISWLRLPSLESPVATINLRKIARKVLRLGSPGTDNQPIWLGPARARLLWMKTWRWPESGKDYRIAGGLIGGPVLSIDVPLPLFREAFSLETRLCSSRYAYPAWQSQRLLLEELTNPEKERQSVEAGFYFNIAFDRIF